MSPAEEGCLQAKMLKTSGGFHTRLMQPARETWLNSGSDLAALCTCQVCQVCQAVVVATWEKAKGRPKWTTWLYKAACHKSLAKEKLLEALQEALPKMKPPRCHTAASWNCLDPWKVFGHFRCIEYYWIVWEPAWCTGHIHVWPGMGGGHLLPKWVSGSSGWLCVAEVMCTWIWPARKLQLELRLQKLCRFLRTSLWTAFFGSLLSWAWLRRYSNGFMLGHSEPDVAALVQNRVVNFLPPGVVNFQAQPQLRNLHDPLILWLVALLQDGVSEFYECGPMKQLKSMRAPQEQTSFGCVMALLSQWRWWPTFFACPVTTVMHFSEGHVDLRMKRIDPGAFGSTTNVDVWQCERNWWFEK